MLDLIYRASDTPKLDALAKRFKEATLEEIEDLAITKDEEDEARVTAWFKNTRQHGELAPGYSESYFD